VIPLSTNPIMSLNLLNSVFSSGFVSVGKTLMQTFIVLLLFYSLVDVNTYDRTPFLRGSVIVMLNRLDF
jgi:hypothetical protein